MENEKIGGNIELLDTEDNDYDYDNSIEDEYGVKYSRDGKKLLCNTRHIPNGYNVREGTEIICDEGFYNCGRITSINLPDSLKAIGVSAFFGFRYLKHITIPKSVVSIGNNAFIECKSLTSIDLPDSITNIGYDAFASCRSLMKVKLPLGITSIPEGLFFRCSSLRKLIIPANVTSIDVGALQFCDALRIVVLPNSISSIEKNAFYNTPNLNCICVSYSNYEKIVNMLPKRLQDRVEPFSEETIDNVTSYKRRQ